MSEIDIDYTNHRGERSLRRIRPQSIEWGSTEWHPEKQWLLHAYDLDKAVWRTFALRDVHRWDARGLLDASLPKPAAPGE